mgnify:CR=1 FL=1
MSYQILFISLGCDKNLVDSEHMLSRLHRDGFSLTDREEEADIIIVNTCAFIDSAKEESIETILEMAAYKKEGRLKALIATGCLSQRYADQIRDQIPEVDGIVGTNSYDDIVPVLRAVLEGKPQTRLDSLDGLPDDEEGGRLLTTAGHYAYLKIAEGCDKGCSYCIIPQLRGSYRSVPMVRLVKEARDLVAGGVRELILVAQETTRYGIDLYGKKMLPDLLDKLNAIEGLQWIRLLYAYPEEIDRELIEAMVWNRKVLHYIDMPIQHGDDEVLRRMGRRTSRADIREKVAMLREAMPDICIRTTVICGFPGETDEMHRRLLDFIREIRFDRLGAFTYSQEEGTAAARFEDQIDPEQKEERLARVMELQQEISHRINESLIGSDLQVMIEGKVADEAAYIGRSYRDAPDVDGYVFVNGEEEVFHTGDLVLTHVSGAYEYDLIGEAVNEPA